MRCSLRRDRRPRLSVFITATPRASPARLHAERVALTPLLAVNSRRTITRARRAAPCGRGRHIFGDAIGGCNAPREETGIRGSRNAGWAVFSRPAGIAKFTGVEGFVCGCKNGSGWHGCYSVCDGGKQRPLVASACLSLLRFFRASKFALVWQNSIVSPSNARAAVISRIIFTSAPDGRRAARPTAAPVPHAPRALPDHFGNCRDPSRRRPGRAMRQPA